MRVIIKPFGMAVLLFVLVGLSFLAVAQHAQITRGQSIPPIVAVASAQEAPLPGPPNLIPNGSMDAQGDSAKGGDAAPANWSINWTGHGTLHAVRDSHVFHSEPASLCLESVGTGDAQGQVANMVAGRSKEIVHVHGFLKTIGNAQVQVAVQAYGQGGKSLAFLPVTFQAGTSDWTTVEETKAITLPDKTEFFAVVLYLNGNGKAWLDDVAVTEAI